MSYNNLVVCSFIAYCCFLFIFTADGDTSIVYPRQCGKLQTSQVSWFCPFQPFLGFAAQFDRRQHYKAFAGRLIRKYAHIVKSGTCWMTSITKAHPLVDANEELAAFQGSLIVDQAEYTNEAIQYILALYKGRGNIGLPSPSSVLIVAHSMGGMVARTLFTLPNHQSQSVNTIITLATPHLAAPAPLDWGLSRLYKEVNRFWKHQMVPSPQRDPSALQNVSLISIAGGNHDTMISSSLTEIRPIVPSTHGFTVYSTSIPDVWTAADHKAILWCNQLVKAISKAIYAVLDPTVHSKTVPLTQRMKVFRKVLSSEIEDTRQDWKGSLMMVPVRQLLR